MIKTLRHGALFCLAFLAACKESPVSPPSENLTVLSAKASTSGPTVKAANPSAAPQSVTLDVQISGSGFTDGSTAQWLLAGVADDRVHTNSTKFVSSGSLVANITIAEGAVATKYDISVATPQGKKGIGTEAFAVLPMVELSAPAGITTAMDINDAGIITGTRSGTCESGPVPVMWDAGGVIADLPLSADLCKAVPQSIDAAGNIVGIAGSGSWRTIIRWVASSNGYSQQVIQTYPIGSTVEVAGMSDAGHFVGSYLDGTGRHAFWWSDATGVVTLSPVPGASGCHAADINNSDEIVGQCTVSPRNRAVVWKTPTSSPTILPDLPGFTAGHQATAINNAGVIAGWVSQPAKGTYLHAGARWVPAGDSWTVQNIGSLSSVANPVPSRMNDAGLIVGDDNSSGNTHHAFVWAPSSGMKDLGSSGVESGALGINNSPTYDGTRVVGTSVRQSTRRAVVWSLR